MWFETYDLLIWYFSYYGFKRKEVCYIVSKPLEANIHDNERYIFIGSRIVLFWVVWRFYFTVNISNSMIFQFWIKRTDILGKTLIWYGFNFFFEKWRFICWIVKFQNLFVIIYTSYKLISFRSFRSWVPPGPGLLSI